MRIGCLQFAPVKGDVNNNLSRADAVLLKENPNNLDILVLPEMAFSGYHFKSLNEIHPHLEHSGSGISSLWARTTALKYDCTVVLGYPEKIDLASHWPASPEYYNSVIMVNGDGETVASYRKSHLYTNDELWALEGGEGFYNGKIGPCQNAALGVSMDINPYKFQRPWHAFEFAFHVLEVEANLVIVTMAWPTDEDSRLYSRAPQDPDMDTLMYWISRFEPLIHRESGEEIIVVLANRVGSEDDFLYAGTSAVIGIHEGEVKVYGLLGRGDKELLVVDTNKEPYGKLVYRPEGDVEKEPVAEDVPRRFFNKDTPQPSKPATATPPPPPPPPPKPRSSRRDSSNVSTAGTRSSTSVAGPNVATPRPSSSAKSRSQPKLSLQTDAASLQERVPDGKNVVTPTCPSPTPMSIRPRISIPPTESLTQRYVDSQQGYVGTPHPNHPQSTLTPHPMYLPSATTPHSARIYGGEVAVSYQQLPTVPEPGPALAPHKLKANRTSSSISDGTEFSESSSPRTTRNSVIFSTSRPGERHSGSNAPARIPGGTGAESWRGEGGASGPRARKLSPNGGDGFKRSQPRSQWARRHSQSDRRETPNGQLGATSLEKSLEDIARRVGSVSVHRNPAHSVGESDSFRASGTADPLKDQRLARVTENEMTGRKSPRPSPRESVAKNLDDSRPPSRRGRSVTRTQTPSNNKPRAKNDQNGEEIDRAQSRGRPRAVHRPPPTGNMKASPRPHDQKSAHSATRTPSAQPIDLSQFQYIEEYPAEDCPFHGSRSKSRHAETNEVAEHRPPSRMEPRPSSDQRQRKGSKGGSNQRQRFAFPKMSNVNFPAKDDSTLPSSHYRSRSAAQSQRLHVSSNSSLTPPGTPLLGRPHPRDDLDLALAARGHNIIPWVETWMPPEDTLTSLHCRTMSPPTSSAETLSPNASPETPVPTPTTPRAMLIVYDSVETNRHSLMGKTLECFEKQIEAMPAI